MQIIYHSVITLWLITALVFPEFVSWLFAFSSCGDLSWCCSFQLLGWLMVAGMAVVLFLLLCMKRCCSPLGYQQEAYWSQFRSNEHDLFQRTADVHSRILAVESVKSYFGFVALEKEEKQQLEEHQNASPISSTEWNRITGICLYREKRGLPLYSRLNKWAQYSVENNIDAMEKEMDTLS